MSLSQKEIEWAHALGHKEAVDTVGVTSKRRWFQIGDLYAEENGAPPSDPDALLKEWGRVYSATYDAIRAWITRRAEEAVRLGYQTPDRPNGAEEWVKSSPEAFKVEMGFDPPYRIIGPVMTTARGIWQDTNPDAERLLEEWGPDFRSDTPEWVRVFVAEGEAERARRMAKYRAMHAQEET